MMPLPDPLIEYRPNRVGSRQGRRGFTPLEEAEANRLMRAKVSYMIMVIKALLPHQIFADGYLERMCLKIIFIEATLKVQLFIIFKSAFDVLQVQTVA